MAHANSIAARIFVRFGDERRSSIEAFRLAGRQHQQRFAMFPASLQTPINASGSSAATTLPPQSVAAARSAQLRFQPFRKGVLFGNSKSYFRFPPTCPFSGGAPKAITRFASFLLCIQKPTGVPPTHLAETAAINPPGSASCGTAQKDRSEIRPLTKTTGTFCRAA